MVNLGDYILRDSPIHGLDARLKIVAVVMFSIMVFRSGAVPLLLASVFLVLVWALSRIGFSHMARSLRPVVFFLLLLFGVHSFFTPGKPLPAPFAFISREGLITGAMIFWQFALLVLSAAVLTGTTLQSAIICGLERLLRPFRRLGVDSHDLAMMVSLTLRFIPLLLAESSDIREAQGSRGLSLRQGSLPERVRAVTSLGVMLTLRSVMRARELVHALQARGYASGERTYLVDLHLKRLDYLAACAFAVFLLIMEALMSVPIP